MDLKRRVAIVNWSLRIAGGVERYIATVVPELLTEFEVALVSEVDEPADRDEVYPSLTEHRWCVGQIGIEATLAAVRDWRPDVLYVHRVDSALFLEELLKVAPAVRFVHDYSDTCISGLKTWQSSGPTVCTRRLAWPCLLHYFPHRCGGLNPATMIRRFRTASVRARVLPLFRTVVTASAHMRDEVVRQGVSPDRATCIPTVAHQGLGATASGTADRSARRVAATSGSAPAPWRLLFIGRMDDLKGGSLLIASLERVAARLGLPLSLTLAGDGPARADWEREAQSLSSVHSIEVRFAGWLAHEAMDALLQQTDLLVVPSIWAEPFGVVGPEAGAYGVPAAAFAVGGIPEWLVEGVNGHLANALPPTAAGLAEAIVRCLEEPAHYARLSAGAVANARRYELKAHMDALSATLRAAV